MHPPIPSSSSTYLKSYPSSLLSKPSCTSNDSISWHTILQAPTFHTHSVQKHRYPQSIHDCSRDQNTVYVGEPSHTKSVTGVLHSQRYSTCKIHSRRNACPIAAANHVECFLTHDANPPYHPHMNYVHIVVVKKGQKQALGFYSIHS